jgi:hypothetical protein
LSLRQLRGQLDALLNLCDVLSANLERDRDLAAHRGASGEVDGLQQALLQVARVRNDVRSACCDLDAIASSRGRPHQPTAA